MPPTPITRSRRYLPRSTVPTRACARYIASCSPVIAALQSRPMRILRVKQCSARRGKGGGSRRCAAPPSPLPTPGALHYRGPFMPLFQKAPKTAEELERCRPLDVAPQDVAAMDEQTWMRRAFRGDTPQLTLRAVAMGSLLGFLLAFTNVYVGLKAGWGLGVALTACIASFTIWSFLLRLGVVKSPMTILENNCMQSTASSAGSSTSAL